ncbi:MAG: hypothetical protein AB1502_02895 [Thermodesulfobacteriota bacterium]
MEQTKIAKQMINFQKTAFNNTFNAITMLQDQAERMGNLVLEQFSWPPEEGKRVINGWIETYKKARDDFKKAVDESFKKVEDFFEKSKTQ